MPAGDVRLSGFAIAGKPPEAALCLYPVTRRELQRALCNGPLATCGRKESAWGVGRSRRLPSTAPSRPMLAEIRDRRIADGGPAGRDRAGRRCVVALVISLPSLMRRDTGHGTPPDSTATGTIAPPDGGDVPTPHRGRLAWWRLRSWRKDVDV